MKIHLNPQLMTRVIKHTACLCTKLCRIGESCRKDDAYTYYRLCDKGFHIETLVCLMKLSWIFDKRMDVSKKSTHYSCVWFGDR